MSSYVIYARKSTESDDQQALSIESQIQEMKALAQRHGVAVSDVMRESRSAKAPGRPVFKMLMRRVARGEVQGILCWKTDRLARNPYDAGLVLQAQLDGKLQRIITSDGIKTDSGNDRLLGFLEFGIATKYIDDLRQNVLRGNRARFERGWPNYRPPPGYIEDRADKTVVEDPERFDLIRRAWDLMLTDTMRVSQIHRILNEQWGYRSRKSKRQGGNPMPVSNLYRILRDPFYMGVLRLRSGATYKGTHRPMVTPEEFERAQAILGRNARPRPSRHEFAYAGLLRCGTCKRALVGEQHVKKSGRRFVYYRCHRRGGEQPCGEPALPERRFEEQIVTDLRRTQLQPEAAEWIRSNLRKSLAVEAGQLGLAADSRRKTLDQAKAEGKKLLDLSLRGLIDDETFAARHAELRGRQTRLEMELDRPQQTPDELFARVDSVLAFTQKAPHVFISGTPVQRRQIVQAVCSNPEVRSRKALYKANQPFSFLEGSGLISSWCTMVEDLRTWLLAESEDHWIPRLGAEPATDIMTEDSYAA